MTSKGRKPLGELVGN